MFEKKHSPDQYAVECHEMRPDRKKMPPTAHEDKMIDRARGEKQPASL
jgi:hypothetical protein